MPIFANGNKTITNMARTKKAKRGTSFVTLRTKPVSKGRESYYLDIYVDGKRTYEFLHLYKVAAVDDVTRAQNKNTEQAATAIRNKRELEIIQGTGGIKNDTDSKMLLTDWLESFKNLKAQTGQSDGRSLSVVKLIAHIKNYKGKVRLCDVDENYCKGFVQYLSTAKSGRSTVNEKTLAKSTANLYFSILTSALNEAVRKKIIISNPVKSLSKEERKPIKSSGTSRPYLTIEEVKKLIKTGCNNEQVKRAFLFGCFSGLRISDIRNLTWDNISVENGAYRLSIVMQKTQDPLTMRLNKQAVKWMPEHNGNFVFDLPVNAATINDCLKSWAKKAGISKDISFHVSRHTFATMELTLGADLYVVSKLLGHKDLSVTQVYAEIISKKREEAVELIDGAF